MPNQASGGAADSTAPQSITWVYPPAARRRRPALVALLLFLLTVISTLAVGAQYARAYANNQVHLPIHFGPYLELIANPALLLLGVPFSFTLLGILLAHELGHYFACRYYGIAASYPYFLPAPTIIGTLGAFIRIRSPIVNRTALFDIGLAGPVVGFLFCIPPLVWAILYSKVAPLAHATAIMDFGQPPLQWLLTAVLRPDVRSEDLLLHPVGRAAWVGLFATALNLLPAGQLDGGHILYALASDRHRQVSIGCALALVPMGLLWEGWFVWAALLLLLGMRHPALLDRWQPLDGRRRFWAVIALAIFLLCFMPVPFRINL